MRRFSVLLGIVTALALWGCATTATVGDPQSIAAVWRGVMTGREMANSNDWAADPITVTITPEGAWTATTRGQLWTGTVRATRDGYELDGTTRPGGPAVWLRLNRYGSDGLGGPVWMDYLGHRSVVGAQLRRAQ